MLGEVIHAQLDARQETTESANLDAVFANLHKLTNATRSRETARG
jgi:hypothetical protein